MSRQSDASPPISEYSVAPPNFVDGLSAIQTIGSVTHLLFTTLQRDADSGRMERTVQVRLVVPNDQVAAIGRLLVAGRTLRAATADEAGEPAVH